MKRILKWLGIGIGSMAALVLCAAAYLFIASQRVVARTYDVPLSTFNAPSDRESVRKGERLATIYGCNNCHGKNMEGTVMYDEPGIARFNAPNLTQVVKDYTDAQLERLIRHGVKLDGTSTWIMPSTMFSELSDEDLGAITAYVRSVPQRDGLGRETTIRVLGRIGILTGQFKPHAAQIDPLKQAVAPDTTDPMSHGRYLVMTACSECHGANLQGSSIVHAPSLVVAAAYSESDFRHLMSAGVGVGNRNLGLMTQMGQVRFSSFTDAEVSAIRVYLTAFVKQGGTALP